MSEIPICASLLFDFYFFFLYVSGPPGIGRGVIGPEYMVEQMSRPGPGRALLIRRKYCCYIEFSLMFRFNDALGFKGF